MKVITLDSRCFPQEWTDLSKNWQTKAKSALLALQQGRCIQADMTGWYDYPRKRGLELAATVERAVSQLPVHYNLVLVIGIGGSYLGTRAVADALNHAYVGMVPSKLTGNRKPIIYAGHNLSENNLVEVLDMLDQYQPIVNVVSKSGTTTEPSIAFRVIRKYLERRFGVEEARQRIIATTDAKSGSLRQLAQEEKYLSFDIPNDIGGRYSVLTPVGIVPLSLAGFDIRSLMRGADTMFAELREAGADHPVIDYAAKRMTAYEHGKNVELLVYSEPKLLMFVEWWKQLFGESQGKEQKGIFPSGLACTTDLHSIGQFVQEGTRNLFETFLSFENPRTTDGGVVERQMRVPVMHDNSDQLGYIQDRLVEEVNSMAMTGTRLAHGDGGVPNVELRCGRLNEETLGALFAFFETACAIGGELMGINPFDQPGVEAYKKNLFALLGKPGTEELAAQLRKRLTTTR